MKSGSVVSVASCSVPLPLFPRHSSLSLRPRHLPFPPAVKSSHGSRSPRARSNCFDSLTFTIPLLFPPRDSFACLRPTFNKPEAISAIGRWSNKGCGGLCAEIRSSNGKMRGKPGYRAKHASALTISGAVVSFGKVAALTASRSSAIIKENSCRVSACAV
jgi:hypothetical protein